MVSQVLNQAALMVYFKLSVELGAAGSVLAPLAQLYNIVPVVFAALAYKGEAIRPANGSGIAISVACAIGLSVTDALGAAAAPTGRAHSAVIATSDSGGVLSGSKEELTNQITCC